MFPERLLQISNFAALLNLETAGRYFLRRERLAMLAMKDIPHGN